MDRIWSMKMEVAWNCILIVKFHDRACNVSSTLQLNVASSVLQKFCFPSFCDAHTFNYVLAQLGVWKSQQPWKRTYERACISLTWLNSI